MSAPAAEPTITDTPPRPDDRSVRRDAEARLRRCGYLALWDVDCDVCEGVVCLRGRLPSYYLKQVAQAAAARAAGVHCVVNRIEVNAPAPAGRGRATTDRDGVRQV